MPPFKLKRSKWQRSWLFWVSIPGLAVSSAMFLFGEDPVAVQAGLIAAVFILFLSIGSFFSNRIYWFVTSQSGSLDSPDLMLWESRKKIVKGLRTHHFRADPDREPVFSDVNGCRGIACLLPVIHDSGVPGQILLYLQKWIDERTDRALRENRPVKDSYFFFLKPRPYWRIMEFFFLDDGGPIRQDPGEVWEAIFKRGGDGLPDLYGGSGSVLIFRHLGILNAVVHSESLDEPMAASESDSRW